MSAALYFRDAADVRWRLENTCLYIGNTLYSVERVNGGGELTLLDWVRDKLYEVPLERLPVSALWRAPQGYAQDGENYYWLARGPCRDRHQGLTDRAMWAMDRRGRVIHGLFSIRGDQMTNVSRQKNRLVHYGSGRAVSRDFLLHQGEVRFRGTVIGEYHKKNIKLEVALPQLKERLEMENYRVID